MIPLVSARDPQAPIAFRAGVAIPLHAFLADVAALAAALPAGAHVFNACTDRYRFAVGLCAALVAGRISLLPPVQTDDMLAQLHAFAPDLFCLHDRDDDGPPLPAGIPAVRFQALRAPDGQAGPGPGPLLPAPAPVPQIPADRTLAWLFTSGSTGTPTPHRKTWGEMVASARASATRLGLAALGDGGVCALVGTVPPQHMYGIECTIMLALHGGAALCAERPFYPADVSAVLAAAPAPRVLVTSPVHLRALMQSTVSLPPAALTLCATAPLDPAIAAQAEQRFGGTLLEIYGSTETGHIATRRTACETGWEPMPGIVLTLPAAGAEPDTGFRAPLASGAHLPAPVALNDAIEWVAGGRFVLHGRHSDMVNIAGKRTSLAYLNQQLLALEGVADGAIVMPPHDPAAPASRPVARPVALVVPDARLAADPAGARAAILRGLRARLDPAFLPRRMLFLAALPRGEHGKLSRARIDALLAQRPDSDTAPGFRIDDSHPALPGHFPGHPIVPGVVLLDHALLQLSASLGIELARWDIGSAKFLSPVAPGEWVSVHHERTGDAIRFTLRAQGRDVASGTLAAPATETHVNG